MPDYALAVYTYCSSVARYAVRRSDTINLFFLFSFTSKISLHFLFDLSRGNSFIVFVLFEPPYRGYSLFIMITLKLENSWRPLIPYRAAASQEINNEPTKMSLRSRIIKRQTVYINPYVSNSIYTTQTDEGKRTLARCVCQATKTSGQTFVRLLSIVSVCQGRPSYGELWDCKLYFLPCRYFLTACVL